jgi:predicted PurR-regulated permease PerM
VANPSASKNRDSFYILCGIVLVTACLYWARQVLIPVALAVLLTFILTPCVSALQRRGLGRVFSVILVVSLALLLLGGVGYIISKQIDTLVANLPQYKDNIAAKIESLRGAGKGGFWGKLQDSFNDISDQVVEIESKTKGRKSADKEAENTDEQEGKKKESPAQPGATPAEPMYVQTAPSGWTRAAEAVGPAAEGLGSAFLVLVLVVFMLIQRENLRNRFVRLLGHGRLIVTTQAFDEGAQRISRYLIMQVFVNAFFGVVLAIGLLVAGFWSGNRVLWQYALLWGFISGSLRFVPYLGTWVAAALVMGFSVATLPGWGLPLGIFAFFVVVELLTANVIEPLAFGHSTGISPLALLLAAAFWTWLWGPVGLILSTPLTVILVVLGKYVPELHFFEVLLGDEPALSTDVTYYQRLVARDTDEATDLVEDFLGTHPPEAVFEEVLFPALLLARKDRDRGELDADNYEFLLQGMRETQEDLASVLAETKPETTAKADTTPTKAVALGCPGRDEADELALQMFAQLLRLAGYSLEVISSHQLSAEVLERIEREAPAAVCIGSLPPGGLAQARYLCKRIRQQMPNVKIVVGRWGDHDNTERTEKRLHDAGADHVANTLSASREQIIPLLQVAANTTPSPEAGSSELLTAHRAGVVVK